MKLDELLSTSTEQIVDEVSNALTRSGLRHYQAGTEQLNRDRIAKLLDLTRMCVQSRNLLPMIQYAKEIARERFQAGFDLQEVQTVFNALEEVVWRRITAEMAPTDYPEAFGLTSTVLGVGKESLAVEYVSLASNKRGITSLDLSALFRGTN